MSLQCSHEGLIAFLAHQALLLQELSCRNDALADKQAVLRHVVPRRVNAEYFKEEEKETKNVKRITRKRIETKKDNS